MAWKTIVASVGAGVLSLAVGASGARATVVADTSLSDWLAHVANVTETTTFLGNNPAAAPGVAWGDAQPLNIIPLNLGSPVGFTAHTIGPTANGTVFLNSTWLGTWSSHASPVNIASGLPDINIVSPQNFGFGFFVNSQAGTGTVGTVPVSVQINFTRSAAPIILNLTLDPNGPAQFVGYYGDVTAQIASIDIFDSSQGGGCIAGRGAAIVCPVGVGDFFQATAVATAVPEPASMMLLGTALAGLGVARRRRRA